MRRERLGKQFQVCKKNHKREEQESQEALPRGKSLLAPPSHETPDDEAVAGPEEIGDIDVKKKGWSDESVKHVEESV